MKKAFMFVVAGLVSGMAVAGPAEDAYQAAVKLKADKEYGAAMAAFDKVAADYPAMAGSAKWDAADCLFGNGLNAEAVEAFAAVAKAYAKEKPVACRALNYQGMALARLRRYEEALVVLDKAVADYPEDAEKYSVQNNRARTLAALKRYDEAVSAVNLTLAKLGFSAGRYETQVLLGDILTSAGRGAEAQAAYRAALTGNIRFGNMAASGSAMKTFGKIDPLVVGAGEYKTFVTELVLLTPATEANARFLGRLKSELEKIKE